MGFKTAILDIFVSRCPNTMGLALSNHAADVEHPSNHIDSALGAKAFLHDGAAVGILHLNVFHELTSISPRRSRRCIWSGNQTSAIFM